MERLICDGLQQETGCACGVGSRRRRFGLNSTDQTIKWICINNRGIVLNYTGVSGFKIGDGMPHGLYFMEAKEDSIALLLRFMNSTGLSEMRMRESILIPYLKKFLAGIVR